MRASRLLSILTTLQARGRVTARALADEFEVSLRTIYRDVDALSAAGVPIWAERGSGGGYRLLDGYRTRLNGLSAIEAEALFLAGLERQTTELGLGSVARSARTKLLAALPDAVRAGAERMGARVHLDAPAWFAEGESLEHLPLVADAVWSERAIRIHYESWKGARERRVDPLGLVLKGGTWYLVAWCDGAARTYRVSRIRGIAVLEERFTRPPDFDLEAHWAQSTKRLEAELHPHAATVRLTAAGLRMMDWVLPASIRASVVIGEPETDGRRTVTMMVGEPGHAAAELLRFGPELEVVSPPELRRRMAELAHGLAALYGTDAR